MARLGVVLLAGLWGLSACSSADGERETAPEPFDYEEGLIATPASATAGEDVVVTINTERTRATYFAFGEFRDGQPDFQWGLLPGSESLGEPPRAVRIRPDSGFNDDGAFGSGEVVLRLPDSIRSGPYLLCVTTYDEEYTPQEACSSVEVR